MVRSTQIDPNEIQFEDFPKEARMEIQFAWERFAMAQHDEMEEELFMVPHARREEKEPDLAKQVVWDDGRGVG